MSNHTPGPWKAEPVAGNYQISGNNGSVIGYIIGKPNASLIAAAPELYEALERSGMQGIEVLLSKARGESTANDALIAAAPDLYAALQECHEAMGYMSEYDIPIGMPNRVSVALAKARGEV